MSESDDRKDSARIATTPPVSRRAVLVGGASAAGSNMPGLGRMANPGEIAEFALMMASDEYPFLTGAALVIDGGKTAQGG